jgi:hypothetical protein
MRQFIASRLRNARGFSVVELTTVLAAVTALSGMAAPAINNYLEEAKLVRARSDVRVIATSLVRMMNDVGAQSRRSAGWAQYDLLTSAGEAPIAATRSERPTLLIVDDDGVVRRWRQCSAGNASLSGVLVAPQQTC